MIARILPIHFLPVLLGLVGSVYAQQARTYNLRQFDASCGQPGYNCQKAFQAGFAALAKAGGGILQLPAGVFTVDFPGVFENIPAATAASLNGMSLLAVPPNTTIQGHVGPDGKPDSFIQWKITSVPVFIFAKASHSGMRNLHLRFTGTTPKAYPFGDVALLSALGYRPTFAHQNQMSGGNYEMFTFAYVFDSDFCTFDNLIFDSSTQDNDHLMGLAINLKAKGVVAANGGGLTQQAESNRITNVQFYDCLGGITIAGQNNFLMENVAADRRGSVANVAPGHLLYTTGANQFDANAKLVNTLMSTHVTIQNITEGPHTFSNVISGGTLALKYLDGAQINDVTSQHPEGLIQTIYVDQNVTFGNMTWSSNYPLCATVPDNCSTPVIYSIGSPANLPATKNLTFHNIRLTSTASPVTVTLTGDNLRVNGLEITTPPTFVPGQKATNAVLSVKNTNGAVIRHYTFTPLMPAVSDPAAKYNTAFTAWNTSRNVRADVTIKWPHDRPKPDNRAAVFLTAGSQDKSPGARNSVTSAVVAK